MDESEDIAQLRAFYETAELPEGPLALNGYTTLINVKNFVEKSFQLIEGKLPSPRKMAISELKQLKALIEST